MQKAIIRVRNGHLLLQRGPFVLYRGWIRNDERGTLLVQHLENVMKVLMLRPRVSPKELIEFLWPVPELEPGNPINTVYQHMIRLRRRLAPLGLIINQDRTKGYSLDTH